MSLRFYAKSKFCVCFEVHIPVQLLCFVYDCIKAQLLSSFWETSTLVILIHQHLKGQASKGNIFVARVNTTQYGVRSVKYTGAILWDTLPVFIRQSSTKNIFKKNLQNWFYESY